MWRPIRMIVSAPSCFDASTAERPDRAVADHGDGLARPDVALVGGVVAGQVDVGQGQQRRHERLVGARGDDDRGAVGLRDAQLLGLGRGRGAVEEAAVDAGGRDAVAAERAGAVRPGERDDDGVADARGCATSSPICSTTPIASWPMRRPSGVSPEVVVRVQVGPAHAGVGDADDRVGRLLDDGVGDLLDADVSGPVHDGGEHQQFPFAVFARWILAGRSYGPVANAKRSWPGVTGLNGALSAPLTADRRQAAVGRAAWASRVQTVSGGGGPWEGLPLTAALT